MKIEVLEPIDKLARPLSLDEGGFARTWWRQKRKRRKTILSPCSTRKVLAGARSETELSADYADYANWEIMTFRNN